MKTFGLFLFRQVDKKWIMDEAYLRNNVYRYSLYSFSE